MANPNLLPLLFTYLVISSISFIITCNADASKGDEHEFSYIDEAPNGPKKWGSLSAEFKACSDGESQSPVDIKLKTAKEQPNDLKKSYKEAPAKLFNKKHALAVEWQGDAGGIEVNGSTYKLVQCHWHTPAEHTIDGKRYDAELHFVHSNDKDQKAVIGVIYAIGESDPFIQQLSESKFKGISPNGNDVGKISASSVTSGCKKYFRYTGSLTVPPCSDGVIWTLAQDVKSISQDQIKLLKDPLDHEHQDNARPIQDLHGRTIMEFEDKEATREETESGTSSASSSIQQLRNGIMMLIQTYVLFLFLYLF